MNGLKLIGYIIIGFLLGFSLQRAYLEYTHLSRVNLTDTLVHSDFLIFEASIKANKEAVKDMVMKSEVLLPCEKLNICRVIDKIDIKFANLDPDYYGSFIHNESEPFIVISPLALTSDLGNTIRHELFHLVDYELNFYSVRNSINKYFKYNDRIVEIHPYFVDWRYILSPPEIFARSMEVKYQLYLLDGLYDDFTPQEALDVLCDGKYVCYENKNGYDVNLFVLYHSNSEKVMTVI